MRCSVAHVSFMVEKSDKGKRFINAPHIYLFSMEVCSTLAFITHHHPENPPTLAKMHLYLNLEALDLFSTYFKKALAISQLGPLHPHLLIFIQDYGLQ